MLFIPLLIPVLLPAAPKFGVSRLFDYDGVIIDSTLFEVKALFALSQGLGADIFQL